MNVGWLLFGPNIDLVAVLKTDQLAGDWWGIPKLTREPIRSIGIVSAEETRKGRRSFQELHKQIVQSNKIKLLNAQKVVRRD